MDPIRYVALGDSYTIGTGLADQTQSFPSRLVERLKKETGLLVELNNLGVNGYTTADLIRAELPVLETATPELVTLLIGANDIVQAITQDAYRENLREICAAIGRAGVRPPRVLVVSIPDFSALPGATSFGTAEGLHARIVTFNASAKQQASAYDFEFVDITSVSMEGTGRADWLAPDELHPGPAQQLAFAEAIWESARLQWLAVRWDRWSSDAKTILDVARREAETRHHAYIGTEHILLGLLRDDWARHVLRGYQVTYERFAGTVDRAHRRKQGDPKPPKIIPTSRTRRILCLAESEACSAAAAAVTPEHVLRGVMMEGEGIGALTLAEAGLRPPSADLDAASIGEAWESQWRAQPRRHRLESLGTRIDLLGRWLRNR